MRFFQAALDTPLDSPFSATLSVHGLRAFEVVKVGSANTDPVRFKGGFGEGLLKDKFAFFEASKNPIPIRRGKVP